jgi:hypothetical protein
MDDADLMGAISFQWKADGVNLTGQNSSELILTDPMVGKKITVVASYTDGQGFAESKTSAEFGPITNLNQSPVGTVTIAGSDNKTISSASEDQFIKVINTLTDTDGLGNLTYEWLANDTIITGQSSSTIKLAQDQVGKVITARVKYTDARGTNESVASTNSSTVANVNDSPTGSIAITGTPTAGQILSITNTLVDEDGIPTSGANAYQYQWLADGINIQGANSSQLTLADTLAGQKVSVLVTYVDNQSTAESVVSASTKAIGATFTGSGSLRGKAGQDTLTADNSTARATGVVFSISANDAAVSGVDTISNFAIATDLILLDMSSFKFTLSTIGLTSGSPVPTAKFTTSTPTSTNSTFIYQSGLLSFDPDGSGTTVATPLVQLTGAPVLTAEMIYM